MALAFRLSERWIRACEKHIPAGATPGLWGFCYHIALSAFP